VEGEPRVKLKKEFGLRRKGTKESREGSDKKRKILRACGHQKARTTWDKLDAWKGTTVHRIKKIKQNKVSQSKKRKIPNETKKTPGRFKK